MKLYELLEYNDIVIQCHDNPDADALSSGYALYWYLQNMGKNPRFIYRGVKEIDKSNLLIMIKKLEIPVSYEPEFDEVPELLITVDCQYGQSNVTKTEAKNIAVIDHHQVTVELPELSEVRSNIGSCATVIWDMMRAERVSVDDNPLLSTALYYGLYTDTNKMSEIAHPLDRDMRDSLSFIRSTILEMTTSNISLDELKLTGKAILDYNYFGNHKYLMIKADQCDPIILAVISDFSMETTDVNVCLSYFVCPEEVRFSIRSCVKEVHANELAHFVADGIGGGGGHITKAGGIIRPELLTKLSGYEDCTLEETVFKEIQQRIDRYFNTFEIIYAKETKMDTSSMKMYEKQPQLVGYVKLTDIFPVNTMVEIRTMEGDVNIRIDDDKYLIIGIEGEIYPIMKEKLDNSYKAVDIPYTSSFEYAPSIKNSITGESKNVLEYAKSIIGTGRTRIYAKPLDTYIKLFTTWDEDKYYSGLPGDYIAVREDDPYDTYIINGRLFDQLYKEVEA